MCNSQLAAAIRGDTGLTAGSRARHRRKMFALTPFLAFVAAGQSFSCQVVSVHDGDGPFHCANGVSIRLAGVQAPDFEDVAPCRSHRAEFACSDRLATEARDAMRELIAGKRIDCVATGKSYRRTVARCTLGRKDLSCLAIERGIAARWARYDPDDRLLACAAKASMREPSIRRRG